ncbi:phage tail tape measure protein, lambda family [Salinihabitans flavidus]|uniref:Phage tail tape measure protein, lambda family n=1 Tax=Salinihabitans flavidus TaxID=569882 RepID=A0A1H8QA39_9RHOB|nr:phage tail tape measure protein [Salinihabitans flavidus]SEO50777.1 phage tail tape measure protein, lambda family [Salinihabitans flavidus]
MTEIEGLEALDAQVDALEQSLGQTTSVAAGFDSELRRMREALAATGQDAKTLERGLSRGLRRAFDGVMFDGMKLSGALETVAQAMMNATYRAALRPVARHFGGVLSDGVGALVNGVLPFEKGAPFSQGWVMPFANGGVVQGPVRFAMRGATGLMGEAGPEAIMPLARGPDGKLGVRGAGGAVNVVMNISTPDAESFRRSQGQIAAQMSRVIGRGQRNR